MRYLFVGLLSLLVSCTGLPDGVEPVTGFEKQRYLGTWYEIARLDHSFERGLEQVTATYAVRDDGAISVLNRGYDIADQEWRQAEGVAKPVSSEDVAHLKVSFFGPFYGTYAVFELADDYSYAFVAGFNTDYLWLLARESTVSEAVRQRFVTRADELGFDVDALIWLDGS
ncbi:MAG: lipocalin [Halieaceae bacterium MED-G27]|jgi:apolipoprotein D and lipocalin family protein|nr:lipocalin [Halieaceae bacterium]OUT65664.1 MAG: lipocalin [Cellvibrionales bacterium TMED21]PDH38191.1 MAG: lipocalin [Halieaceae bacterium MED-G27]|tara:strand:- start:17471 stop:17980 length:510 start_codon:yes stop_codon:yes gene_type:complete